MKVQDTNQDRWSENVIIADADYIDKVAFHLTVNFERMLGRRVPPADFAQWAECVALDGGLHPGAHQTDVVLLHDKQTVRMENFAPGHLGNELNGQAFQSNLGEFSIHAFPAEEMVDKDNFYLDTVQMVCAQKEIKRVMLVPDGENAELYTKLRNLLARVEDEDKRITVFGMEPMAGGNFRQEILGYSMLRALGIKAEEITEQ